TCFLVINCIKILRLHKKDSNSMNKFANIILLNRFYQAREGVCG
ncbi:MAG: hypothetical protein UT39_C0026G0009, partial [Candidatus Woesebacteria bacterium GW2011_GWA1_39_21]